MWGGVVVEMTSVKNNWVILKHKYAGTILVGKREERKDEAKFSDIFICTLPSGGDSGVERAFLPLFFRRWRQPDGPIPDNSESESLLLRGSPGSVGRMRLASLSLAQVLLVAGAVVVLRGGVEEGIERSGESKHRRSRIQ